MKSEPIDARDPLAVQGHLAQKIFRKSQKEEYEKMAKVRAAKRKK